MRVSKLLVVFSAFVLSVNTIDAEVTTVIDATAGGARATEPHDYTYFSFADNDVVPITDVEAKTSLDWHIAFKRYDVVLNGGVSGPGNVRGYNIHAGYKGHLENEVFSDVSMMDMPEDESFVLDSSAEALSQWYSYDVVTHVISASGNAYELRTADGQYAKWVVDTIEGYGRADAGTINFRWVVGEDLNVESRSASVDVSEGREVYFNLRTGQEVSPSEPQNSLDWDLWFSGYSIKLNGGVSGSGEAAALPAYESGMSFEDIVAPVGAGYISDQVSSVFSDWYDYDMTTHTLFTKNHTYLINTSQQTYKIQLLDYYKSVEGSPVSGWITFRWAMLEENSTVVTSASWSNVKLTFDSP
tara:strand:+ start:545 stop:1615 length:1071 start_codon:yes stop_codon:yes gene_type:complete